jgi:collagenase-like PrtC family protease
MSELTVGPIFFHWSAQQRRDFYFRLADEAPVDRVYLGEVVCSKREPLFAPYLEEVSARLRAGGKTVVYSTLALVTTERELELVAATCAREALVEANDVSAVHALAGKPFVVGPFVNVLNEAALDVYARRGATRVVFAMELDRDAIGLLAHRAASLGLELEVQVYGRQPLAVSMRCYSARKEGLHKDNCQYVCEKAPDGLAADAIDGRPLYSINGTQTLSHGYLTLLDRLSELQALGVRAFRLSPQLVDLVEVARLHRQVLDQHLSAEEALVDLKALSPAPFINGYFHGRDGMAWVPPAARR